MPRWADASNTFPSSKTFATPYPALESLLAKGAVVARFPRAGGAADVIGDNFHGPALTLFTVPQMGPEILIVKLKQ